MRKPALFVIVTWDRRSITYAGHVREWYIPTAGAQTSGLRPAFGIVTTAPLS